jgi:hypothetical protein
MFRSVSIILFVAASLLLPLAHGLHYLAETGKPMYLASHPPPGFAVDVFSGASLKTSHPTLL